jgi:hypothetical protein
MPQENGSQLETAVYFIGKNTSSEVSSDEHFDSSGSSYSPSDVSSPVSDLGNLI